MEAGRKSKEDLASGEGQDTGGLEAGGVRRRGGSQPHSLSVSPDQALHMFT